MDAEIRKFFDSVGAFFTAGDSIPWCEREIIAVKSLFFFSTTFVHVVVDYVSMEWVIWRLGLLVNFMYLFDGVIDLMVLGFIVLIWICSLIGMGFVLVEWVV